MLAPKTFAFFARDFIAGWVFLSVRSWSVKGERPKPNDILFEAVALSLINQLLTLLTTRGLRLGWSFLEPRTIQLLVSEILIQPALLGLIVGYLAERNWMPDGLRRLLMPAVQPVNSALGFAVDQIDAPSYIIITYQDGYRIYGFLSTKSFARSEGIGGLLIERLYTLSEGENWIAAEPKRRVWVSLEGAQTIEFISSEDI